jgi:hypothetical protein
MAAAKKRLGDALLKMARPTDAAPPAAPPAAASSEQAPPTAAAPPKAEARPEPPAAQPAPQPAPQPAVSADDARAMLARASSLIREGQIASARSLLQLALRHPAAPGETFNIGPARSHSFDEMVPYLAGKTGLRVQRVGLFTDSYRYETSIAKAVATLGYAPEFDFFRMVDDAAAHR